MPHSFGLRRPAIKSREGEGLVDRGAAAGFHHDVRSPNVGIMTEGQSTRPRLRTREALGFLAAAGETLASSLDYESTLQSVAELAVPRIACYCIVDLLDESGELRRPAMAHVDPARAELLRATAEVVPELRPGLPLSSVLAHGEALLVERVTEADLPATQREQLERLDTQSFIAVPLVARGRTLGALELGSTRTDRYYGEKDVDLALELGRVAALFIDNARLFTSQRDAVSLRDEVLSIVAHDLRNPLNTIQLAGELLAERVDAETEDVVRVVLRSVDSMNRLIQDLLDVAKAESGTRLPLKLGVYDVGSIIDEVVAIVQPQALRKGLRVETDIAPMPLAEVDRNRMFQVLENLLGNALKFTDRGSIRVSAGPCPNGRLRVAVEDTGSGIAAAERAYIFDRFWQARKSRRGGAGLGLAIAKSVVESHGGEITVRSEEGVGTTFEFTIPVIAETT
jgi:signal transduction histidine kinase